MSQRFHKRIFQFARKSDVPLTFLGIGRVEHLIFGFPIVRVFVVTAGQPSNSALVVLYDVLQWVEDHGKSTNGNHHAYTYTLKPSFLNPKVEISFKCLFWENSKPSQSDIGKSVGQGIGHLFRNLNWRYLRSSANKIIQYNKVLLDQPFTSRYVLICL